VNDARDRYFWLQARWTITGTDRAAVGFALTGPSRDAGATSAEDVAVCCDVIGGAAKGARNFDCAVT